MSIRILFTCDGCYTEYQPIHLGPRIFRGVNGKSYGFGSYEYPTVRENAPEGWQAYDPFTGMCYCPVCWSSIENGPSEKDKESAQ